MILSRWAWFDAYRAIRENGALMCDFGPEASPKDGVVGDGGYIAAEHEFHA